MSRRVWTALAVAAGAVALSAVVATVAPTWAARLTVHGLAWSRPGWLWWALAAWFVPLAAPWSLTDLPRAQQALQVLVRMALVVLLVVAAAGPHLRRDQPRAAHVIHLVDRSDSVPDELLRAAEEGVRATGEAAKRQRPDADPALVQIQRHHLPWSS